MSEQQGTEAENPQSNVLMETDVPEENREDVLLRAFAGPNAERFVRLSKELRKEGKAYFLDRFNPAVLLIGIVWFFYRKLYLYGLAVLLVPTVAFIVFPELPEFTFASLAVGLSIGCNWLYLWYARRRIAKIEGEGLDEETLLKRLEQAGGTSYPAAFVGVLIVGAILVLPNLDIAKPSLPGCTDASVQKLAGELVVEQVEAAEVLIERFVTIESQPDGYHNCSFVAVVDGEEIQLRATVTWLNRSEGEYQVRVAAAP